MNVQPFKNPGPGTAINNIILDSVMGMIKPSSWAVLCIIVRETIGRQRSTYLATYGQLKKRAGIRSRQTIGAAVKELEQQGIIFIQNNKGKASSFTLNENVKDYLKKIINEIENDGRILSKYYSNELLSAGTVCPVCSKMRVLGNGHEHTHCNSLLSRDQHGVFKKADYKCLHCGEADPTKLTVDHIIPRVLGGNDHPDNLQSLCKACNSRKGAKYDGN